MNTVWFVIGAYLIGSVSFAVVVSKLCGLDDPRTYGSKNPGATNVLRSGSKKAAILTLLGDGFKGWLAVWLTKQFGPQYGVTEVGFALVIVAVFLGHLWPVFFKFIGGKGVATALGVLLGISGILGLAVLATWLVVALVFKYSSLAALIASIAAVIYGAIAFGFTPIFYALVVMSLLLIYRHKKNIANLLAGQEGRIGAKKTGTESASK